MSDINSLEDITLEDYNKALKPWLFRLVEKMDESGAQNGFLLQATRSGDTWLEIFHNDLNIAIIQTEAFIQGGQIAVVRCQENIQEFLASAQEENGGDAAPDDPAKATAFFEWQRRQNSLKFFEAGSEQLKQARWPLEVQRLVDPKTSLVSYALVDKTGYHVWTIQHGDRAVVGLVLAALTKGVIEGEYLATQQMNQLQPARTLEEDGGKLN